MGLRFPNGILFLKASANINRATANLVKTESAVSSGKRVQTLSDDPSASTRIISLSRELLEGERYINTINQGKSILEAGTGALQSVSEIVARAREIALAAGNPSLSQLDRDALADEVGGMLDQAIGLANTKSGGRYVFGGSKTGSAPYSLDVISGQEYAIYNGDLEDLNLLVAAGIKVNVTLPGETIFKQADRGAVTFKGTTGAAAGTNPSTGNGNDTLEVTHNATTYAGTTGIAVGTSSAASDTIIGASGTHTMAIDHTAKTLSLDGGTAVTYVGTETDLEVTNAAGDKVYVNVTGITASATVNITATGYLSTDDGATLTAITYGANQKIVDSVTGELLNVNSAAIVRTGDEYVTYEGTFDLFTALKNLRDDLRNTRNLSTGDQVQSLKDRIDQFVGVHETVLSGLSILGERINQLSLTENHNYETQTDVKQLLSLVQDTDLAQAISEFSKAQIALQYAQSVTAKLLNTNFLNFL